MGYDANGNLGNDGSTIYVYDPENRMVEVSGQNRAGLTYDPLLRLSQVLDEVTGARRRMLYHGDALIAEYDPAGTMLARHVHGPAAGADDPLVSYAGGTVSLANARFLYRDMRGSIVAEADRNGTLLAAPAYDEYGVHAPAAAGQPERTPTQVGFTGQAWVPQAGLYYYKARMYSPTLGRFMQTDPIGYGDGMGANRASCSRAI